MDTLIVKGDQLGYSYNGGLKTSSCNDLVAIVCDKPNIWLKFKDKECLLRVSLLKIEIQLQEYFMKINRQVIVNMNHVSELVFKGGAYWVYLKNGMEFKVSERREKKVRESFLKYAI
ncbi:LytTR family DNA-binding domain-containing protein [Parabacteroides sp. AF17-28]|uniref:LytTR family DNA-binding domain-containing protein n=1 Tax=Parabacteroides sp. AF17-28 TaxID=2292241 RepID=UPI000EFFBC26|nr:LytTR family DNA-binding domain-containing protein [Parabacteroides sp. AF17-28]RHR61818.1 LytTR family transcriptional regulator [Parabacteroides sp. AF17-28]